MSRDNGQVHQSTKLGDSEFTILRFWYSVTTQPQFLLQFYYILMEKEYNIKNHNILLAFVNLDKNKLPFLFYYLYLY